MEPMPNERSRVLVIAFAVVAGALLTAVAGGALWWMSDARKPEPAKQTEFTPAQETEAETVSVAPSVAPMSPAQPDAEKPEPPAAESQGGSASRPDKPKRRHMIAYVFVDRTIRVSNEDGAGSVSVAPAPSAAAYALSPDGAALAVVADAGIGRINVFSTSGGALRMGGRDAYAVRPSISPDGKHIAYSSGSSGASSVRIMESNGANDRVLVASGALPKFSPDGVLVAFRQSAETAMGDPLSVADLAGASMPVAQGSRALSFAWAPDGTLYFSAPAEKPGSWDVWASRKPFRTSRRVGTVALQAPAYALCDLHISPDGDRVLSGARGDDGYCRVLVLEVASGSVDRLATRRAATPYGWASDGRMLYFEGNAFQGEATSLMSARPDGTGRRVVVEGAAP